jgi:prephenate dehydrogenase
MTVQITIIGMGQVGTSIGLALAKHSELVFRVGHDKEITAANAAKKMGALDRVDINIPHAVADAGLVILAVPLHQVRETLEVVAQDLRPDVVVMDMAPVKETVLTWAKELLPEHAHYIGVVPVINPNYLQTHDSGTEAAHADLFQNGLLAIVSGRGTPSEAIKLAADLSQLLGAEHLFIDPVELDSMMSATHLLPQLVAAALLNSTVDRPGWREARMLTGRPYAEATGPAALFDQHAALAQAALGAREHVLRNLDNLIDALNDLRHDIYSQDAASMTLRLENARKGYERWWQERNTANWGINETAPKVEMPTVKDIFGRMVGIRRRKNDPDQNKK